MEQEASKNLRVLIKDNWALNLGDVAIAESMIDQIRSIEPKAEIILESSHPEITKKYFDDVTVIPRLFSVSSLKHTKKVYSVEFVSKNLPFIKDMLKAWLVSYKDVHFKKGESSIEAVNAYKKADIIFSAGGDFMSEHYGYLLRAYEISLIAKLNKPIILYAQSIGPFRMKNLPIVRKALNKATLILSRDATTTRLMGEYGITAPVKRTADCVILLKKQSSQRIEQKIKDLQIDQKTVGVVIRDVKYTGISDDEYYAYKKGITDVIKHLENQKHRVIFVSPNNEDNSATEALKQEFGLKNEVLLTYDYKPSEIKYLFSKLKMLISARMHPLIISSTAGTPVLCTGREFKMRDYMNLVGLGDYYADMIPFDTKSTCDKVDRMLKEYPTVKSELQKSVLELEKKSSLNVQYAKKVIDQLRTGA